MEELTQSEAVNAIPIVQDWLSKTEKMLAEPLSDEQVQVIRQRLDTAAADLATIYRALRELDHEGRKVGGVDPRIRTCFK